MDTMDQSVPEINALDQDIETMRKETESWFEHQHVNNDQETQPMTQGSYYKYQNSIDKFNAIPVALQWWKTLPEWSPQTEYQPEEVSSSDYPLNGHSITSQSSELFPEVESNRKQPINTKHSKKPKMLKEHTDSIKRTKHPEQWKVNIKKNARLRGEEYIGVGGKYALLFGILILKKVGHNIRGTPFIGKVVPAKIMGPPCKCRMHCSDKIEETVREELHHVFWKTCNWEQRKQYIALLVKESPKQRTRCRGNVKSEHRRQVTFTYSLLLKGEFVTVCKCMFLSTFAVSEKFVRHAMDKKRTSADGIIEPDQRGRHTPKTKKSEAVKDRVREHIKSFPTEKSSSKQQNDKQYLDSRLSIASMHKLYVSKCKEDGVPENDVVKESYYREMFKTEFNLAFKRADSRERTFRNGNDNTDEMGN